MAARYWRGTTSNDWGNTANWSASSGGATGASVPTSADDVTFDSGGNNNCNTGTTARNVLSITFSSTYTASFNFGGTLNIYSSATFHLNTTYTSSGTPVLNTSANSANKTITSGGVTLPVAIVFNTFAYTTTLVGDLRVALGLTAGNNANAQTVNGDKLYVGGGCTVIRLQGTSEIVFNGSGTLTSSTFFINSLTIDTSGTYTFSGTFIKYNNTLKYVSGTVVTTGSTLQISNTTTIDTNGITWNSINFFTGVGNFTFTLNSLLTANTITFTSTSTGTLTFAGAYGFTTNTLTISTMGSSRTWQLTAGNTYTINSAFNDTNSTSSVKVTITSTVASSYAYLTLSKGASMDLGFTSFTDIDASGGRSIWVWKPTLTSTLNINSLIARPNVSKTFVS